MVLLPILFDHIGGALFGGAIDSGQIQNLQHAFFGALIIFFLAKEPNGLVALIKRLAAKVFKPRSSSLARQ